MTAEHLLVLIPTFDEVANIESLVGRVRLVVPDADILVVDDASPDGTGAVVQQMAVCDSRVQLLARSRKQGLGAAYVAGYAWGLQRRYQVFVQMDADGSHSPEQLPDLLRALTDADLVLGSRWVPGGSVVNWPRHRMLLSRAGNGYTRALLGLPVHDVTGGFRVLRRATVERLHLPSLASAGYSFQVDVVHRAVRAGCRVVEVPISFRERERGVSKMSKTVVCEALWRVTMWGLIRRGGEVRDVLSRTSRHPG